MTGVFGNVTMVSGGKAGSAHDRTGWVVTLVRNLLLGAKGYQSSTLFFRVGIGGRLTAYHEMRGSREFKNRSDLWDVA